MVNEAPGTPNLSIMSFTGGFHGRSLGALSATRSKAIHKVDIPAFHWPVAPFPQLKYPLEEHASENAAEEARCLARMDEMMTEWKKTSPVAGVIMCGADRARVNYSCLGPILICKTVYEFYFC